MVFTPPCYGKIIAKRESKKLRYTLKKQRAKSSHLGACRLKMRYDPTE